MSIFSHLFRRSRRKRGSEIFPDEIFLDASNIPQFDQSQFEGRIEKPVGKYAVTIASICFVLITIIFTGRLWALQIGGGENFNNKSENNRLRHTTIFSKRGVISDRNGQLLAYNEPAREGEEFSLRKYTELPGMSHVLGYVKYPSKDSSGFYYKEDYNGVAGMEKYYDYVLSGENGLRIIETDALGKISTESVISPPRDGDNLNLSIDAELQSVFHDFLVDNVSAGSFKGSSGVLLDVTNGEIIALTNVPEYDSNVLTSGGPSEKIQSYLTDKRTPFLNRATDGLYTPGSIVKPVVAMGVLAEKIIDPRKQIFSSGSISVPNQYDPTKETLFNDWRAHGYVDVRRAIAVSSNVYFYTVTGGHNGQAGIGIDNIVKYVSMFGLGSSIKEDDWLFGKKSVVPSPEWKKRVFSGESWRLGDTYNTSIGQYGFQVTPLQIVRAIGAIANGGTLLTPTFVLGEGVESEKISLEDKDFQIIREGMRQTVESGTATSINYPFVKIAAKTGTAEVGVVKGRVNSWIVGFFPYEKPKYAFVVLMENGPDVGVYSAARPLKGLLNWMSENRPEYFKVDASYQTDK